MTSALTQHVRLKLQQLSQESQVRGNDLTPLLHKVEGLIQTNSPGVHEVGQADGGRARDARLAVHQHTAPALLHSICGWAQKGWFF